ncbi:dihydrodipicolinate synthase family protein [Rhodococcus opacus]|uniref:Dihydrodipicolinate synthetase n=1 Tax=Rhodococcus opacus TaxID=37919 RepID=A0A076F0S4_RHOOP|nr:dihydrodipicolinate synthase family protein [Rhodococcus opacus]AII11027.1 dihydrodipicolinate synthetase [Rhodococcus opacus]
MVSYTKNSARDWAKENLRGVSGVTIPSFTRDLTKLNAKGIAHDIEHLIGLGYDYTLVMSELNLTPEENAEFTAVARETAGDRLGLFFHASFGTLEENIRAVKLAEQAGADLVLLSYPPQFWPTTEREIYNYTKTFCDATNLGVMLFPIPTWGFERIHPAGMSVDLIRRMIDTIPNVVAIKAEQGYPLPGGVVEMYHHFADEVVISCPIESHAIPLMDLMDIQFSGTSNTQWMSTYYPEAFAKARGDRWTEAMDDYWRINPARQANDSVASSYMASIGVINRTVWKYQDWLAGFNGGPLRAPAMRVPDKHMRTLRAGLTAAGLPVTEDPDSEFMHGRYPA